MLCSSFRPPGSSLRLARGQAPRSVEPEPRSCGSAGTAHRATSATFRAPAFGHVNLSKSIGIPDPILRQRPSAAAQDEVDFPSYHRSIDFRPHPEPRRRRESKDSATASLDKFTRSFARTTKYGDSAKNRRPPRIEGGSTEAKSENQRGLASAGANSAPRPARMIPAIKRAKAKSAAKPTSVIAT